jgi:creatinine amidohydrolase
MTLFDFQPACPASWGRSGLRSLAACLGACLAITIAGAAPAKAETAAGQGAGPVYLDDLTTTELRSLIANGTHTALVPVGGTEQSGPYLVLGKHNARAQALAGLIARQVGHTVVAPVLAYVPEGNIHPPQAHMRFAGTLSVPEPVFEAVLVASARSLCQHGLTEVFFLGDHGGYQKNLVRAAAQVNAGKGQPACRATALTDYYQASQTAYVQDLKQRGLSDAEIGSHAGSADTALSLALAPAGVRSAELGRSPPPGPADGVHGDPRRATAELGQLGVRRIVDASVAAIRLAVAHP